jgi:alkylation response protein AidB-like acyl-CoA dehydrogenase
MYAQCARRFSMGGISLLLIDRNSPGVTVRRLETQGWWMSYTAYITFEDVRVRADNLIGTENQGLLCTTNARCVIVYNVRLHSDHA